MHDTAMANGRRFFQTYMPEVRGETIVDIGAQDVNGSLRQVAPPGNTYVGVDFVAAPGVDVVMTDPYRIPLEDGSADAVVTSSVFEHSEFFWLLFNDILRVLKPAGLLYINTPSNGVFHRYPVDCWRFYPDSGMALQNWGNRSGYDVVLLESYLADQGERGWNDMVTVFLKDRQHAARHGRRIQSSFAGFTNGLASGQPDFAKPQEMPEDKRLGVRARLTRRLRRALGA